MCKPKLMTGALCIVFSLTVSPVYAIFGVGAHYSLDFSISMPDTQNEALVFEQLSMNALDFGGTNAAALAGDVFGPEDLPIYFDRNGMTRTPFALGAKVYIDIIPLIDVLEVGGDIGCWEYNALVRYPDSIAVEADPGDIASLLEMKENDLVRIEYDTMDLTLEGNGLKFPGISKTPYVKLDLNLTIRKYIKIPVIEKVILPYAGAGFDVHFATPVPSAGLIEDALGDALKGEMSVDEIAAVLGDPENQKKVTQEILYRLMTPHTGMNIVAGLMIKPPVIPFGVYADGKFMIPFGLFDEDAEVKGLGFKLNTGLMFHIG